MAIAVMAVSFTLVSLFSTDLVPRPIRDAVVDRYLLKVIPCIFAWFVIQGQLLFGRKPFWERAMEE